MAKKKSKKRTIIIIAALAVVLVVVVGLFMSGRADEAIAVTTTKVERRTITQTVSAIGKIQPETEVKISSETSGEIVFLSVEEGDTVKKGQLLARIKPDIIETQLEQQSAAVEASRMEIETRKAEMEKAKTELSRIRELFEKEFASKKELEMAQAAYDQAVAGYKAALARLEQAQASFRQVKRSAERTTITSPMNGIITSLSVEEGENVVGTAQMAGTEMMRVSDLSVMNAVVEVDENDIVKVNLGDTSRVEIDALPENIYKGVVIEIG
ncbi:MAG: efflux RND transporter periplasmic adaptor subunit, partial [Candidatus Kapaibacterium sp.]